MKIKKKPLLIGVAVVVVVAAVAGAAMRGKGDKTLEVQTAKVDRQKIVQKVSATGKIQPKTQVEDQRRRERRRSRSWRSSKGSGSRRAQFLVGAGPRALRRRGRERGGERQLRRGERHAGAREHEPGREGRSSGRRSSCRAGWSPRRPSTPSRPTTRSRSRATSPPRTRWSRPRRRSSRPATTCPRPPSTPRWPGPISELNKEQGEIALGSQFQKDVILVIADLSEMEAQVNVDENDIVSIAIGQQAEIEVDALPDQKLKGVVYEIANSANVARRGHVRAEDRVRHQDRHHRSARDAPPGHDGQRGHHHQDQRQRAERAPPERRGPDRGPAHDEGREAEGRGDALQGRRGRIRRDRLLHREGQGGRPAGQDRASRATSCIEILDGLAEGDEVVTGSYRAISRDLENGAVVTDQQGAGETQRSEGEMTQRDSAMAAAIERDPCRSGTS